MSSSYGYFITEEDLAQWLHTATRAAITKNKVRKDLWSSLNECVQTFVPVGQRSDYIRIPRSHYVSLHTLCLTDGKGADTLSNDQMLNFATTLDELLGLLALREQMTIRRGMVELSVDMGDRHVDDDDARHVVSTPPPPPDRPHPATL